MLLFADVLLGVIIAGVIIYGKISVEEEGQMFLLQMQNPTQKVFSWQEQNIYGGVHSSEGVAEENVVWYEIKTEDGAVQNETVESKQIALTFDDGPDPDYTPLLLEGLRERGVQATFFLLGQQVALYPDIVEEMYADGHEVGIHAYEHVNLIELSESEACEQIQSTGDLIYDLTGEWPVFVRPPYGNWPSALDDDFCLVTVLWDIDPLDWATGDTSLVVQRITETVDEFDVILLHDASESSVQAALQVIDLLSQEGYEFVTVEELIFP